jgi:glycosyltransferase involved in cell wall biosynthesis
MGTPRPQGPEETLMTAPRRRGLIIFGTIALYGMERGVIEIFDLLRPEIEPHFLISQTPRRLGLPVFDAIETRHLPYSFLSDRRGWERLAKPRSPVHLYRMLAGLFRGNIDALREIRRHDFLYIPNLFSFYYACAAMLFCRLSGRRVVYHVHDIVDRPSMSLRIASWLITDLVHNTGLSAQLVFAAHPYLRRKRNVVIPYPTSTERAATADYGSGALRNGRRHVVFVGQVARHKGVDILIDAFERLADSSRDVTLDLVGGCSDPVLKERLDAVRPGNGCDIHYWGYRDNIFEVLKLADVYVHPTPPSRFSESFGIGVVEAMSVGVPSVSFGSGALREIVVHEQTGLVCQRERPAELAGAIERFLTDEEFRKACGSRARQRYEERYSSAMIKRLWLEALEDPS